MKTAFLTGLCLVAVFIALTIIFWVYGFIQDVALVGTFFSAMIIEGSQYG